MEDRASLTFSQRTGITVTPPQLKLGELDEKARNLLHYAIYKDLEKSTINNYNGSFILKPWETINKDAHVKLYFNNIDTHDPSHHTQVGLIKKLITRGSFNQILDYVEF
ncbi:hypothetical protein [Brevundimonas sp.]|uniref:hypothetical protein n=1 Tax=Brevundimonas sp. TaxID=1871086 RepID=UPI002FCA21A2